MPDPFANLWKQAATQHKRAAALRQSAARQSAKRSLARSELLQTKTLLAQHIKTGQELLNKIRQARVTAAKLAAVKKMRQKQ